MAIKQSTGDRAITPRVVHTMKERRSKATNASASAVTVNSEDDFVAIKQRTDDAVIVPGAVLTAKE